MSAAEKIPAPNELRIPGFLQNAIVEAMKVQLSLAVSVTISMETPKDGNKIDVPIDVVSLMGIKSSLHTGSIALAFPKATFLQVLEAMVGEKHTEISSENADACSELLNIIYASARVKINDRSLFKAA